MKNPYQFMHQVAQGNENKAREARAALIYVQLIVLGALFAVFFPIPVLGDLILMAHSCLTAILSPTHPEKMWVFYLGVWALPSIILLGISQRSEGRAHFFSSFFSDDDHKH
jgi:hypothetical protein